MSSDGELKQAMLDVPRIAVSLSEWQKQLWQRPLSDNILRWQSQWAQKCGRACCWSSMCGSQQCGKCAQQLVSRVPPLARYVCMECDFGDANCENNPGLQLCATCFMNPLRLHHHRVFCLISPLGEHSLHSRKVGFALPVEVTIKDLVEHVRPPEEEETCAVCLADFDEDTGKPVSPPGCKFEHGIPLTSSKDGVTDSKTRLCAACCLRCIQTKGEPYYRGSVDDSLCEVCRHEASIQGWQKEFESGRRAVLEFYEKPREGLDCVTFLQQLASRLNLSLELLLGANNTSSDLSIKKSASELSKDDCLLKVKLALKELHKQRWIHGIIDFVF